jgi:hypothetical protein
MPNSREEAQRHAAGIASIVFRELLFLKAVEEVANAL